MRSDMLGFVELILVFSLAIGWGLFELLSLRKPREPPPSPPPEGDEASR